MPVNTDANPFVANIDAAQNLTVLQGFFGDGTANKKRIYFSMDLRACANRRVSYVSRSRQKAMQSLREMPCAKSCPPIGAAS